MYVSKDTDTKGNKSFNPHEFSDYRIVRYPGKEVRDVLNKMQRILDFDTPSQIGFKRGLSIKHLYNETRKKFPKISIMIDIEKAFDSITEKEVVFLLNKTFRLNVKDAKLIAKHTSVNGYIYQGSPLSPILFNIMTLVIITRLSNINGIRVVSYADDFTILYDNHDFISHRFLRFLLNIIKDCGWKINKAKTRIRRKRFNNLGMQISRRGIKPLRKKKHTAKLLSLIGQEGKLEQIRGIFNWIYGKWSGYKHIDRKLFNTGNPEFTDLVSNKYINYENNLKYSLY